MCGVSPAVQSGVGWTEEARGRHGETKQERSGQRMLIDIYVWPSVVLSKERCFFNVRVACSSSTFLTFTNTYQGSGKCDADKKPAYCGKE